jgi:adenylyltransferase/sulfurtransferase
LGSPAALYLAAGGVGTIGLADFDRVEAHNLQRQILHGTSDVNQPKTVSGSRRIADLNPHVRVVEHTAGITPENAVNLFADYDVILDGSDNFSTRYLNTDAAFLAGKPLAYGSIFKFEGQVTVFHPRTGGPCYRCLFPEPPPPGAVPNCGEAGVLGALCGVIGSLQAMEVIKHLTGAGEPLTGRLLVFDALAMSFRTIKLRKDPDCPLCSENPGIRGIDANRYDFTCETSPSTSARRVESRPPRRGSAPLAESLSRPGRASCSRTRSSRRRTVASA